MKKNMPLFCASCANAAAMPFSFSKGSVVWMTNCTGSPKAPGSGGGWNTAARKPAIFPSSCVTPGWRCAAVALRSFQGLSTIPASVCPGMSSWNT